MSTRSFNRIGCNITAVLMCGGFEYEVEHSFSFVCPFSLYSIQKVIRIGNYIPKRFVRHKLDFYLDNPKASITEHEYFSRCSNWEEIRIAIVREFIYILSLDIIISYYEKDILASTFGKRVSGSK